jgi:peptidoglycan/xylan/chitin deacetylase (PgdA/CDA1 family)
VLVVPWSIAATNESIASPYARRRLVWWLIVRWLLPFAPRRRMDARARRRSAGARDATIALIGLLAPALTLALGVSAPGEATGASRHGRHRAAPSSGERRAGASIASSKSPPPPQAGYRIVGCRSSSSPAYLHGPARREVAIGFDDGPAPDTPAFVRMLERSHARATFFMIGEHVSAAYRPLLLRELKDGDALGDHTYTHPYLTRIQGARGQLLRTIMAIRAQSGYTPCVFRPPYGAYDPAVVDAARSLGLATVLWNVDPADWAAPRASAIEQRILAQVRPGSIIISHDGGGPRGQTLAAYPAVIAALRRRGYEIVTITELLGFRPVYVPCIRLCAGIALPRSALPRGAIVERAR